MLEEFCESIYQWWSELESAEILHKINDVKLFGEKERKLNVFLSTTNLLAQQSPNRLLPQGLELWLLYSLWNNEKFVEQSDNVICENFICFEKWKCLKVNKLESDEYNKLNNIWKILFKENYFKRWNNTMYTPFRQGKNISRVISWRQSSQNVCVEETQQINKQGT